MSRRAKDGERPNDDRFDVVVVATEEVSDSKLSQLGPLLTGGLVNLVPMENSGLLVVVGSLFLLPQLLLLGCLGGNLDMVPAAVASAMSLPDSKLLIDPFLRLVNGGSDSDLPPSENDLEWFKPSPRIRLMRSIVTRGYNDEMCAYYMLTMTICKYLIQKHNNTR